MDAELKRKWVEALRSGKYRQGRGVLRSFDDEYCCLGVLCELVPVQWERVAGAHHPAYYVNHLQSVLPTSVKNAAALRDGVQLDLANMNDRGKSFAEIADWIEGHL